MSLSPVHLCLVHHPVVNRNDERITSVVDEFDFFDACRLGQTYRVAQLLIVNPVPAQRDLTRRLIAHGASPSRHGERGRFERARWVPTLDDAIDQVASVEGRRPTVIATTARAWPDAVGYDEVRRRIDAREPILLLVGKAWGLHDEVLQEADRVLEPIRGPDPYNHLSVRSAMAIMIDRLLGRR